ncbi:MAG: L,D-transpeptidase [Myxococcales bacterium]|nr:L,D-transpeptidase [Myxococcales bacterium]
MAPGRRLVLCSALALGACGQAPAPPDPAQASSAVSPASPPPEYPTPPPAEAPRRASIGALSSRVFVRQSPRATSPEIGQLHIGAVVPLREPASVGTDGCAKGWYAVEPEGYVCLEPSTTLDVDTHPVLLAKRAHHGDFDKAIPLGWSTSREGLLYRKLPTVDEQRRTEFELDAHLARLEELRAAKKEGREPVRVPAALRNVDLDTATGAPPNLLASGALSPASLAVAPHETRPLAKWIPARSAIAWTDEFVADGRSWVLTDDLLVAPKDKLVSLEPSPFGGVHIDGERVRLPLAFIRHDAKPKFRVVATASDLTPVSFEGELDVHEPNPDDPDPLAGFREDDTPGAMAETPDSWPRLASVGLTGRYRKERRVRYLETTDGAYIREHDATMIDERPPRGFALADGEKWVDISIFRGTLVAYEGERAVFATLISPGANGYRREAGGRAKFTTPTGTFRIEWKHRSTTMTPDPERKSYYLSEVPFTQFFYMPFALHAAYWHDRFGEPKSGGCVNLSVRDAKWLFDWTEPRVPETWHSVRSGDARGPGTWVRVR